jgi:8-oxo-dGTP diphosphatase
MNKIKRYNSTDKVMVAVDCIIFGFDNERIKLLLIKRSFEPEIGKWSLMGGFLKKSENLDQAAARVLKNLTGLENIYLEQLYSYSKIDRDPVDRTISVAYFALISIDKYKIQISKDHDAKWFDINDYPKPIFDHSKMIKKALVRLRRKALTYPIGFELLPEKFTMKQLQDLYESIFNKEIDKRNFISKVISLNVLIKTEEKDKSTSKKGAFLYRFDENKYNENKKQGYNLSIKLK